MILGFFLIISGLGFLMALERIFPDQELKQVPNWWVRVLSINFIQLLLVVLGMYTWETWLQVPSVFRLGDHLNTMVGSYHWLAAPLGGLFAYLVNTWIFYWWHRARHEVYIFWVLFHQMHHSAQRIETITSFYKHPLEILADSIMMTFLIYPVMGLDTASSIWLSAFSAFGEYFYHMNIRTPRWVGYFFQRPESHRIHHLRNKRVACDNYSDCPWWDILGGTFSNPERVDVPTGFETKNETRFWDMMWFKDVLNKEGGYSRMIPTLTGSKDTIHYTILPLLLLILGCLQPMGYLFDMPELRGLGAISTASPLPLVFSAYNGVETFSTEFYLVINYTTIATSPIEGSWSGPMTRSLYKEIRGPYNRRNVFGVVFSHGPFFKTSELVELRNAVLDWGFCKKHLDFVLDKPGENGVSKLSDICPQSLEVYITSKSAKQSQQSQWVMKLEC